MAYLYGEHIPFWDDIGELTSNIGFDRDLGIAGRVMVKGEDGTVQHKLVHIDRPSKMIPLPSYGQNVEAQLMI